jgi:predicted LPLAT superfamily acyltransferase
VVPVYNHGSTMGVLLEKLHELNVPCVVVNDGSDAVTSAVLTALAEEYRESMDLVDLPTNQGKGVAVITGMRRAEELGYTHGLQIDADGQHNSDDIPSFIGAAKAEPEAMIMGRPVYDESVPSIRMYCRYTTHVLVWAQTLSFAIQDTMCGFRMYPLSAFNGVARTQHIGPRMDFDTEVAVRLYWSGIGVVNLATPVKYPEGGLSNYRMFKDNVRMAFMHTRLLLGMLIRIPRLLKRKDRQPRWVVAPESDEQWFRIRERGSMFGMRFALGVYKYLGRHACRLLIWPVTAYFYVTDRRGRDASRKYFERLYSTEAGKNALGHEPGRRDIYRQFRAFGDAAIDKFAAWFGHITRRHTTWHNRELALGYLDRNEGVVLLGAHLGNLEAMRGVIEDTPRARINALMWVSNAEHFMRVLTGACPQMKDRLIAVDELTPQTSIMLQQKISDGEFIAMMGDRLTAGAEDRNITIDFLGAPARFPQGPLIMASLLKCPVLLVFALRTDKGDYEIHMEKLADRIVLPRKDRASALREYLKTYAERLEHYACKAPHQWFNFYDFWDGSDQ